MKPDFLGVCDYSAFGLDLDLLCATVLGTTEGEDRVCSSRNLFPSSCGYFESAMQEGSRGEKKGAEL